MAKDAKAASIVSVTRSEMDRFKDLSLAEIEAELGGFLQPITDVIGSDGWGVVVSDKHKDMFVGQPFILMFATFYESDKFGIDGEFVSCAIVTRNDERFILNDGSTGICQQLRAHFATAERGVTQQVYAVCPKGLRKSEYVKTLSILNDKTGKMEDKDVDAVTYYLDSSL